MSSEHPVDVWMKKISTSTSATATDRYYADEVKRSYVKELERAKHDFAYYAERYYPKDLKKEYLLQSVEDIEAMHNARAAIHKKVADIEKEMFETRGRIGCDIKDVIVEVPVDGVEEETPEAELQYFDPKDLDI